MTNAAATASCPVCPMAGSNSFHDTVTVVLVTSASMRPSGRPAASVQSSTSSSGASQRQGPVSGARVAATCAVPWRTPLRVRRSSPSSTPTRASSTRLRRRALPRSYSPLQLRKMPVVSVRMP